MAPMQGFSVSMLACTGRYIYVVVALRGIVPRFAAIPLCARIHSSSSSSKASHCCYQDRYVCNWSEDYCCLNGENGCNAYYELDKLNVTDRWEPELMVEVEVAAHASPNSSFPPNRDVLNPTLKWRRVVAPCRGGWKPCGDVYIPLPVPDPVLRLDIGGGARQ